MSLVSKESRRPPLLLAALTCAAGAILAGPAAGSVGEPQSVPSAVPRVAAAAFVVADVGTGEVLAARAPHRRLPPASTLKLLTVLTAVRGYDPATVVRALPRDTAVECSCVGVRPGRSYRLDALLMASVLASGNDAATAATEAAGGTAGMLRAMRATAYDLRAGDTRPGTPSGLDAPGQATSAYDLALIVRAGLADPRFRRYFTARSTRFGPIGGPTITLVNQDPLYRSSYPGRIGGKYGWTTPARYTFAGAARRGGRTLVVTLLGADAGYAASATALLDWGFARAGARPVGSLVPSRTELARRQRAAAQASAAAAASRAAARDAEIRSGSRPPAADTSSGEAGHGGRPAQLGMPSQPAGGSAVPEPVGSRPPVHTQALFSLGAVAFTGLALWPGREPRPPRRRTRRRGTPATPAGRPGTRGTPRGATGTAAVGRHTSRGTPAGSARRVPAGSRRRIAT